MSASGQHKAHLLALRGNSLALRATWQLIACVATGTGYCGGQGTGQAEAAVARGRALVVAAAQPSAAAGAGHPRL